MPRRNDTFLVHPLPFRWLSIFLTGLLSLPGPGAQAQPLNSPAARTEELGASDSRDARAEADPEPPAGAPVTIPDPNPAPDIAPDRLACKDPDLRGRDVVPFRRNAEADKWGDITIAQPKIWQFERVSALLDGLLRDVEGISLGDLTQLDPSAQNGAALKFIQSALEVGVQYDQAAAVNAANTLSNYNEVHTSQTQQLTQYNNYMQTLTNERDRLAAQYSAASNEVNALSALKAAGTSTPAQDKQLADAVSLQASTQASLASVNSLISGAGAAPTLTAPPTVPGTSVQKPASGSDMSSSLMGFSEVLKSLPDGVQKNLSSALNAPSYPATKRLDNFITLLYERLAREVSVLQDDLTRDPENVAFLLQFDVGLYPSNKAKDHVARVEFNVDCPGCKVYSLYPGQSSYNIANYSGSSKRNTFWGNVLTLIGFGASASYRRQTDMLQGSLVQSVYTAGFQNGVLKDDNPQDPEHKQVNANQAEQSFGWYYGAAPFEKLVTPGIRSTFALITVPRKLIQRTEDAFGNTDGCLPFHIDAGWANRNDPMAEDGYFWLGGKITKYGGWPVYHSDRDALIEPKGEKKETNAATKEKHPPYLAAVMTAKTSVNLPATLDDYSLVGSRERHKMHVLRMEYNTVYEQPDSAASATVTQTNVQTSNTTTNAATGQTTGQTTNQSTATSVTAGKGAAGATNATASDAASLDPLPCPKGKCAPVLLKLDRPIDPNLVVTVRGEPLMRVRDWRGRATSVLPPAQSGSDLAGAASTAGSLALNQLAQTRGLLESDKFAPNTWFPLNSHELLLNISVNVATNEDFPVIQLADPSGSVVIPHDLRREVTELIVDGFRLRAQTEKSIQVGARRQYWRENEVRVVSGQGDAPISVGPYAFSTYLPLFSREPAPRRFFVMIGETGNDLLIGFLPQTPAQKEAARTPHFEWLGVHSRVILEDRDLDLAWSLSCDAQGDLLACTMPREEISRAYYNFRQECPNNTACPGLEMNRQSLTQSKLSEATPKALVNARDLRSYRNAYVSTMQLWVEQTDPDGENFFYSPEPVRIPLLPLSDDYWLRTPFKPWEFASADADSVALKECNYFPSGEQGQDDHIYVSMLGLPSWRKWLSRGDQKELQVATQPDWTKLADDPDKNPKCGILRVPTAEIAHDPIVFNMEFPPHAVALDGAHTRPLRTTVAIPRHRLGLSFEKAEKREHVIPATMPDGKTPVDGKVWDVVIPVIRSTCADKIELPFDLLPLTGTGGIGVQWWNGSRDKPLQQCSKPAAVKAEGGTPEKVEEARANAAEDWKKANANTSMSWQKADEAERVRLYLEIPRSAILEIPDKVEVVRTTSDGTEWVVGALPNLRRLLLPTRLTLEPVGTTQFVLRGENAGEIDAVWMQGSAGDAVRFPAASGADFALVTVKVASATAPSGDSATANGGSNSSMQIIIDTTKDNADHVNMTTNNMTAAPPAKAGAGGGSTADATPAAADKPTPPPALAPGSYAVIPLIQVGMAPPDEKAKTEAAANLQKATQAASDAETKLQKATQAEKDAKAKLQKAKTPDEKKAAAQLEDAAKSDLAAKQTAASDAQAKVKTAKTAADDAAKPTPKYVPLAVRDEKGKELIFTIADAKKASAAAGTAPAAATSCTTACVVAPCAVACPPGAAPAAKTP